MKRLFLLRHAKSSWDDAELADRERPLAPRGRRATDAIAGHLGREGIAPALIVCSSARRARETLEGIAPALGEGTSIEISDRLYDATEQDLLERLREVDDGVESVMLIGHNPSIERLALGLASEGDRLDDVRRKYPTGALATLELGGTWGELAPGAAVLADFVTPKGLVAG